MRRSTHPDPIWDIAKRFLYSIQRPGQTKSCCQPCRPWDQERVTRKIRVELFPPRPPLIKYTSTHVYRYKYPAQPPEIKYTHIPTCRPPITCLVCTWVTFQREQGWGRLSGSRVGGPSETIQQGWCHFSLGMFIGYLIFLKKSGGGGLSWLEIYEGEKKLQL